MNLIYKPDCSCMFCESERPRIEAAAARRLKLAQQEARDAKFAAWAGAS